MYSFNSRVRYSEVDENQELSLKGIINYLQDCSTFQSEDLKMGIDYLSRQHRAWWLSSWQIVMERYPKLGEEIVISTWPYGFKGMYGYRNFTICDKAGNYLVKANSVWFLFDLEAGRPVKVEEQDVRGYGSGQESRLDMDYADRKLSVPEECQVGEPVTVIRQHLDTNHHVNNSQYVAIARDFLPDRDRIRELRVEYKKAAVLGDVMVPHIEEREDGCTVALCSQEGQPFAIVWTRTA